MDTGVTRIKWIQGSPEYRGYRVHPNIVDTAQGSPEYKGYRGHQNIGDTGQESPEYRGYRGHQNIGDTGVTRIKWIKGSSE